MGAPWLAALAVPGFDAAGRDQYVTVLRLVAVTPALFAASIAVGELLVAHRRFVGYGLAPVLYNGGIAGGTFLLAGRLGVVAPALGAMPRARHSTSRSACGTCAPQALGCGRRSPCGRGPSASSSC